MSRITTAVACCLVGAAGLGGGGPAGRRTPQAAPGRGPLLLLTLTGHTQPVQCLALSRDGARLASGAWRHGKHAQVKTWDARTGRPLLNLPVPGERVGALTFSRGGSRLTAVVTRAHGKLDRVEVKVWDATSGRQIRTLALRARWPAVALNDGASRLAWGARDGLVRIRELPAGKERILPRGHARAIRDVGFSANGRRLASAGSDHSVTVYDLRGANPRVTFAAKIDATLVALGADGTRLVCASFGTLTLWDTRTGKQRLRLRGQEGQTRALAFAPGGRCLASAGDRNSQIPYAPADSLTGDVEIWDLSTGKERFALTGHGYSVNAVVFSTDGTLMATGGEDKTVKIWRVPK